MNRVELIEALRNGEYATTANGDKLVLVYRSNPIMKLAADEIEAMDAELKELRKNMALMSNKYLAMKDILTMESYDCYWY